MRQSTLPQANLSHNPNNNKQICLQINDMEPPCHPSLVVFSANICSIRPVICTQLNQIKSAGRAIAWPQIPREGAMTEEECGARAACAPRRQGAPWPPFHRESRKSLRTGTQVWVKSPNWGCSYFGPVGLWMSTIGSS